MQSDSVENEDDEAAYVDAFFLPGGILDPEEDNRNNDDDKALGSASGAAPLLFSGSSAGSWLVDATGSADITNKVSTPSPVLPERSMTAAVATSAPTAWFDERLLMTDGNEGLQQQQDVSTATETKETLSESLVVQPPLTQTPSGGESVMQSTAAAAAALLETWAPKQKEPAAVLSTAATAMSKTKPSPPPPPGFERSPILSAKSPSFSPRRGYYASPSSPARDAASGAGGSSSENKALPLIPALAAQTSKVQEKVAESNAPAEPSKSGSAKGKAQPETSYRAAVVSQPPQVQGKMRGAPVRKPKAAPRKQHGNVHVTRSEAVGHGSGIHAAVPGSDNEWTTASSSSHGNTGAGNGPSGDPSSGDEDSHADFHDCDEPLKAAQDDSDHQSEARKEELEWNEITRSSHGKFSQEKSSHTKAVSATAQQDGFVVVGQKEKRKSGSSVHKSDEKGAKGGSHGAKSKSHARRQSHQGKGGNVAAAAEAGVASDDDGARSGEGPDGFGFIVNVLSSAIMYLFECFQYSSDVLNQVFVWSNEILFPALKKSLLATASSALHSLRGIFLLLLAAFHAYSFAADETLAQMNLESAWIPYVSLIYAPTATRHIMNYVDLPHFTPHLVSSAVLCFLFRRPAVAATSTTAKRPMPDKPTTEDLRNFLLQCCQLFIPFDLVMDGFTSVNTTIMTLSYTDRLLLAYVICVVRKGWMLVPCAWLSFAVQCLVAVYFPWKHILAEPILLFILFSIGMASLNVLRILEHWKQRAKKAIGKNG